jgi:hypothetical protein
MPAKKKNISKKTGRRGNVSSPSRDKSSPSKDRVTIKKKSVVITPEVSNG